MNISKTVRISFTIIGLITIILAVVIFLTKIRFPFTSDVDLEINQDKAEDEVESKNINEPTFDDFLIVADNVSFNELKTINPELTRSTAIQNTEDRKKFVETILKNREQVVHDVLILPEGITSRAMIINRGDLVKFTNELGRSITIENLSIADSEESSTTIDSKDSRAFGFDFLGEFDFKIDGIEFKVFVEKNVE